MPLEGYYVHWITGGRARGVSMVIGYIPSTMWKVFLFHLKYNVGLGRGAECYGVLYKMEMAKIERVEAIMVAVILKKGHGCLASICGY